MIPSRSTSWAVAEEVAQSRSQLQPPEPAQPATSSRVSPIIPPRSLAPLPTSSATAPNSSSFSNSGLQLPHDYAPSLSPRARPVSIPTIPAYPSSSTSDVARPSPPPSLGFRPSASTSASPRSSSMMMGGPPLRPVSSGSSLRNEASTLDKADSMTSGRPEVSTRASTGAQSSTSSGGVSISALRKSLYDPSAASLSSPAKTELGLSPGPSLLPHRRASAGLAVPGQDQRRYSPASSPSASRLTPRKATGPTGLLGDEDDAEEGDDDDDEDLGTQSQRRAGPARHRLSMIDFLAAGPPDLGLADPRWPSQPPGALPPSRHMSGGPSLTSQMAQSGPRSASAGDRPPRLEPREAALSTAPASSSAPRVSELLDFLNDEPPPGVVGSMPRARMAPGPASRQSSAPEAHQSRAEPLRAVPISQPTPQQPQPQRILGRPGSVFSLSVRPADDRVTMFGSTHTSSHYSVSGRVVITVRPQAFLQDLRNRQREAAPRRTSTGPAGDTARPKPQARASMCLADEVAEQTWVSSPVDQPQQGQSEASTSDSSGLELDIKSLRVSFTGYSLYCDHSGRFSALRLAEASEELLPNGCKIPLRSSPPTTTAGDAFSSPHTTADVSRYESDFDLTVPGWLPGSMISRFGATFYCLHAEVRFKEPGGPSNRGPIFSSSFGSFGAEGLPVHGHPSAGPIAVPPIDTSVATLGNAREPPSSAPSALEAGRGLNGSSALSSQNAANPAAGPNSAVPSDGGSTPTAPNSATSKAGKSWLGKRAKQLQLRAKASISPGPSSPSLGPSDGSFGSGSAAGSSQLPGANPQTFAQRMSASMRPPKPVAPERDASGNLVLRSDYIPILVRRCREVVPVPVARLALVGSEGGVASAAEGSPAPAMPAAAPSTSPAPATAPTPARDAIRALSPDGELISPVPTLAQPAAAGTSPSTDASPSPQPVASIPPAPAAPALAPAQTAGPRPVVTDPAPPALRPRPEIFPPAPSMLGAPSDPAKLAAMASQPAPPVRASSSGAIERPGRGVASRRGNGMPSSNAAGVPMRHFLHRPVLHPPADAGMEDLEGTGLPFALTLSVPSYVQVDGANSDMLSFGVQIEVGRSSGWLKVQELGGLRLRDMELICEQSERHSSVPSRTFRHNFPVPSEPMVEPEVLPRFETAGRAASLDTPLRLGYDHELVDRRILLTRSGRAPDGAENSVERYRVSVVGPPPSQTNRSSASGKGKGASNGGKSKGKSKESELQRNASDSRVALGGGIRSSSSTTAAALMAASAAGGTGAMGASGGPAVARSASRDPRSRPNQPVNGSHPGSGTSTPNGGGGTLPGARASGPSATGASSSLAPASAGHSHEASEGANGSAGDEASGSGAADASERAAKKKQSRMSRAVQMAMRGISDFAIALADMGLDGEALDGSGAGAQGGPRDGAEGSRRRSDRSGKRKADSDEDAPRATYSFKGDDGHGVDLTKGRVRMTVNLPLVSSSLSVARGMGWPQLVPDYEAPYLRIKHKLKVKLGFGFGQMPLGGDGLWGQALVMCVPVRFTDSPPKEVKEQFAPQPLPVLQGTRGDATTASNAAAPGEVHARGLQPPTIVSGEAAGAGVPAVLPAYTQLFNEDGSRLADDGEDLPQYPGPPRPQLPHRGSVTAPGPRPITASPATAHGFGGAVTGSVANVASAATALTHASLAASGASLSPVINRIAPSRVVDEGFGLEGSDEEALGPLAQARRELEELQADEEEEHQHQQIGVVGVESTMMDLNERLDETVDMDGEDVDDDGDGDDMEGEGDADDDDLGRRSRDARRPSVRTASSPSPPGSDEGARLSSQVAMRSISQSGDEEWAEAWDGGREA